jgi:hypothetical protein
VVISFGNEIALGFWFWRGKACEGCISEESEKGFGHILILVYNIRTVRRTLQKGALNKEKL